ncbi:MAG: dolichyl-phosphate beta-glucosyltransferase [Bryobacteraceae bacterium]
MENAVAISLILPAYNEAATIARTIGEVAGYFAARQYSYEVIVAADGNDGTRERAGEFARANPAIKVIGEITRRGKGRGIREAVSIASGDIIGFADADNKVPIEEFGKLQPWLAAGFEVVIGSRGLPDSKIERRQPLHRRIGSKGFGVFMHSVVGLPEIVDTQCGFKFFRGDVARDLFRRQQIDGYMYDVEILALAQRLGYRIKEVPIRWHDDADSRLQLFRGNLRNAVDIFKIRLSLGRLSKMRFPAGMEVTEPAVEAGKLSPAGAIPGPDAER